MLCRDYCDSFLRPNSKEKDLECARKGEGAVRRVFFVGAEGRYSCGSLTQTKPNKSFWLLNTKGSGKLVVTLLI